MRKDTSVERFTAPSDGKHGDNQKMAEVVIVELEVEVAASVWGIGGSCWRDLPSLADPGGRLGKPLARLSKHGPQETDRVVYCCVF